MSDETNAEIIILRRASERILDNLQIFLLKVVPSGVELLNYSELTLFSRKGVF